MGDAFVFVSPHLDDAVYSCGATIKKLAAAGHVVKVVTLFSGSPTGPLSEFANELHSRWVSSHSKDQVDPTELRRVEDKVACQILGAECVHLDFLDCIYRKSGRRWLYDSEQAIFGPVANADTEIANSVAAAISVVLADLPEVKIFGPLGIGNHVDHQFTHQLLTNVFTSTYDVFFYEDYPYSDSLNLSTVLDLEKWERTTEVVTRKDIEAKVEAICAYKSQFQTFWKNKAELTTKVGNRWENQDKSEVYWQAKPSSFS